MDVSKRLTDFLLYIVWLRMVYYEHIKFQFLEAD